MVAGCQELWVFRGKTPAEAPSGIDLDQLRRVILARIILRPIILPRVTLPLIILPSPPAIRDLGTPRFHPPRKTAGGHVRLGGAIASVLGRKPRIVWLEGPKVE